MEDRKPDPRIMAFYLPQFHRIPENDEWWGKGFTEWVNVKRAQPLFTGHEMPYLPHPDIGYYDLARPDTLSRQAELARSFGVSGFCFYHYWFNGKLLLEKPLLYFLEHPEINLEFCVCWANESWSRNWNGGEKEVLQEQNYGGYEDWLAHFDWLAPFLRDRRAIRFDGAPLILIYRTGQIAELNEMIAVWRERAREMGIEEIRVAGVLNFYRDSYEIRDLDLDAAIEFEPFYSLRNSLARAAVRQEGRNTVIRYPELVKSCRPVRFHRNQIPGICPRWDNTPRHQEGGATIFTGCDTSFFENQLHAQFSRLDHRNPFVFVNAWNEWAEGCTLEPDSVHGYSRLEALKRALDQWRVQ